MTNCVAICLFVSLAFTCVCAQVGSLCRPNERLLPCGCPKTCKDPVPDCEGVCQMGCFCEEGEVRNDTGHCVKLADCPPASLVEKKLNTSEPRLQDRDCPPDEEYRFCEPCLRTCEAPNPLCPAQCARGCFCKGDLLRDNDGRCVPFSQCSNFFELISKKDTLITITLEASKPPFHNKDCPDNEEYRACEPCLRNCLTPKPKCTANLCTRGCFCKGNLLRDKDGRCVPFHECSNFLEYIQMREKNYIEPVPYRFTCGPNQVYKECEKCTRSCSDANPVCGVKCKTGCFCKEGLVKGPDGSCMKIEDCPKATMSYSVNSPSSVEVEDCSPDEEYFSCGWCEPTCRDPHPACPAGCTRGCQCRPPLLRHSSGKCVTEDQCGNKKCSTNEEFVCRSGCEATCSGVPCVSRPRRCTLACYCKPGYLRNGQGQCVSFEQCLEENAEQRNYTLI